jgi:hypothetical protein
MEFFKSFIKSALEPLKLISSTTFILYLLNAFFSLSEISTEYSLLGSLTIITSLTPTSLKTYAKLAAIMELVAATLNIYSLLLKISSVVIEGEITGILYLFISSIDLLSISLVKIGPITIFTPCFLAFS